MPADGGRPDVPDAAETPLDLTGADLLRRSGDDAPADDALCAEIRAFGIRCRADETG